MKLTTTVAALVLASATGQAAAESLVVPLPPRRVPMLSVPCIPSAAVELLAAAYDTTTLCWDTDCLEFDLAGLGASPVPQPLIPAPRAWPRSAVVRTQGSGLAACRGDTCRPLGPKLTAAIGRWRAQEDGGHGTIEATADLTLVVLPPAQAWRIASDSQLALKIPKEYLAPNIDRPELVDLEVAGDLVIADWSNCAGPCIGGQLVDTKGKNIGATFQAGGSTLELYPGRFAVFSEFGEVVVFTAKGDRIAQYPKPHSHSLVGVFPLEIDADSANFVMVTTMQHNEVHLVQMNFAHAALSVSRERIVPMCSAN